MDMLELEENLQKEYHYNLRMYFNEDFSIHKTMENHFKAIINNIKDDKTPISIGFEELSEFYLMTALYAKIYCEDKIKVQSLLDTASWYSYNLIEIFNTRCTNCHQSILLMRKAILLWSSLFLVGEDEKVIQLGEELIDSLNAKGSIIRYGSRLYPESWFLIDLYTLGTSKVYNNERVDYPEDMNPYEDILKEWNTLDLVKVDNFVGALCEMHLLIEDKDPAEEYLNFSKSIVKLYLYEILFYLNFRRIQGLENPKEFSHPLMNTEIVKKLLKISKSLEQTKELPYANELIAKLKKECPAYDKQKQNGVATVSKEKTPPPKVKVPKAGKYRATLPNEHSQAKQLESDPHSYARFKKDDTFTYEGLEDYELSHITWRFIED